MEGRGREERGEEDEGANEEMTTDERGGQKGDTGGREERKCSGLTAFNLYTLKCFFMPTCMWRLLAYGDCVGEF